MSIEEELEDSQFEKLLYEKQHKEMMSSLRLLIQCIEKLESSDAIVAKVIQKQSQEVVNFIDKFADQKPPNININQDKVIKELNTLSASITPILSELKDLSFQFKESIDAIKNRKPTEWEFTVDRGFGNRIEKITAKPKNS